MDFGIARKILNDRGEIKAPRISTGFKGTVKFASISCHKRKELGRKDDCESWFYLLLDLLVEKGNHLFTNFITIFNKKLLKKNFISFISFYSHFTL